MSFNVTMRNSQAWRRRRPTPEPTLRHNLGVVISVEALRAARGVVGAPDGAPTHQRSSPAVRRNVGARAENHVPHCLLIQPQQLGDLGDGQIRRIDGC